MVSISLDAVVTALAKLEFLVFEDNNAGSSYANESDFLDEQAKRIVWCHGRLMKGYKDRRSYGGTVKLLEKKIKEFTTWFEEMAEWRDRKKKRDDKRKKRAEGDEVER